MNDDPKIPTLTETATQVIEHFYPLDAGLHWPKGDLRNGGIPGWGAQQWVQSQTKLAAEFALLVPRERRHTAVCAGAHIGIMPITYAMLFEHVLAFEPDPVNFAALTMNMNKQATKPNGVQLCQAALGASGTTRWLAHNETNSGASYLLERFGKGDDHHRQAMTLTPVDVVMLDQFHLQALDLLQIDVEGYEHKVLEGAQNTIRMHRPLIIVEMNGLSARYTNCSGDDAHRWLLDNGYKDDRHRYGHDCVYRWQG